MARKYYQGKYQIINREKYRGDADNIIYRSSYELKAFKYLDLHPNVIVWNSEEVVIPYVSPIDNKSHRYFIDLYFKLNMGDGTTRTYLAEIKPKKFTEPPIAPKRKTKSYLEECITWEINNAKWKAAREVCADNGIEFMILTEKELGIK